MNSSIGADIWGKIMKDFLENIRTKWNIAVSPFFAKEVRVFAGLEVFCVLMSSFTLLWLSVSVILSYLGCAQGKAAQSCMAVLLSAAVGYLTNYLAIEMLFKPYKKDKKHLFAVITFGYWKQGLISRNKHKIGLKAGEVVGEHLLNPETIADELCSMVSGFLKGEAVIYRFKEYLREGLKKHEKKMAEYLAPRIEKELASVSRSILTPEKIQNFIVENVMPFITKESVRESVAAYITGAVQQRVPGLVDMLKAELRKKAYEYLKEKTGRIPLLSELINADMLASGLVVFVDWEYVRRVIKEKISGDEFSGMVKEEIAKIGDKLSSWLSSAEAEGRIAEFAAEIHIAIEKYLHENLADMLSRLADGLIGSEELWAWAEKEMLPAVREKIEELIRLEGKDLVLKKLDLNNRISKEIDRLEMDKFHAIINDVAAENLGAIQVIGWVLGLVIGLVQLIL